MGLVTRRTALLGIGAGLVTAGSVAAAALAQAPTIRRAAPSGRWATGGTAAMRAAATYPDPFARPDTVCQLTCEQILGPCWAPRAPVRRDISEGEPGLPLRTALRLVDADGCTPMAGAEVEVWHTSMDGVYSASDVEGSRFCTRNDSHALTGYFFRGRAITDARGVALFDGCYPGWYGGRSVHVHLLARLPANAGEGHARNAVTVTQLYFPEEVTEEIFASVPGYRDHGQPSTVNATDNVLRRSGDAGAWLFGVEQMADGAMLAWKTVVISDGGRCGGRGFTGGFPGDPSFRP